MNEVDLNRLRVLVGKFSSDARNETEQACCDEFHNLVKDTLSRRVSEREQRSLQLRKQADEAWDAGDKQRAQDLHDQASLVMAGAGKP